MTEKQNCILRIDNLIKIFDDAETEDTILKGLNLTVQRGEFMCILGPSGCGKTTFLRCIAGFEEFDGQIYVDGHKCSVPGTDRIMVFQDFNQLFPWKTVEQNFQYPLKLQGLRDKDELRRISEESLIKVKLQGYERYYPHQLSGGMKQRVAIAKALALKPALILMDEPFAALDAMTRSELQEEVLRISEQEGSTVIFVTHNIEEAITLGTRILVFQKGGQVVFDEKNPIKRPVTPLAENYGAIWEKLHRALHSEDGG